MAGQWNSALCDCCSCKDNQFCITCVFPGWVIAENTEKAGGKKYQSILAGLCYSVTFYAQCIGYGAASNNPLVSCLGALHCLSVCGHGFLRGRIRNIYSIQHSCGFCDDWCTAIWCYPCALSQEHTQLKRPIPPPPTAPPAQANAMQLPPEMKAV
jgi:Cys-rich protein (TIGR01571 family)